MWAKYSIDQKNFTGHMFNIKLEEKSYKMSLTALPVKIQWSKSRQGGTICPPGVDRVKRKHNPKMTIVCYQVFPSGQLWFSVSTH